MVNLLKDTSWRAFFSWLLLCTLYSQLHGAEPRSVSLERALQAWKDREQRVRSARIYWKTRHTYTKGSINGPEFPKAVNPTGERVPAEDYTFAGDDYFFFEADKARYGYQWQMWHPQKKQFFPQEVIQSYDGQASVEYMPKKGSLDYPQGTIRREQYCYALKNIQVRPILLAFRPSQLKESNLKLEELVLSRERPVREGHSCLVLTDRSSSHHGDYNVIWMDPDQDYGIVRYQVESRRGSIWWIIDISWSRSDTNTYIPLKWRISRFNSKRAVTETSECGVTSCIINDTIPDSEFQVKFPSGTLIIDASQYPKPSTKFLMISDNEKWLVPKENRTLSYDELMNKAIEEKRGSWERWFFLAAVVVFMAGLVLYRRLKKRPV